MNKGNIGHIKTIRGSVIEAVFDRQLPHINTLPFISYIFFSNKLFIIHPSLLIIFIHNVSRNFHIRYPS